MGVVKVIKVNPHWFAELCTYIGPMDSWSDPTIDTPNRVVWILQTPIAFVADKSIKGLKESG